jgi:serine/threonine-protein kinase HipA
LLKKTDVAAESLTVLLHDMPVGTLSRSANGSVEFRLLDSYKGAFPRPTLGQQFLDDLDAVQKVRSRVPAWFSNLLPEGGLRALIARQVGVQPEHEFFLLRHLGRDLPGAVRIEHGQSELALQVDARAQETQTTQDADWHFSLAGVQLKFSAREEGKSLTIPVGGVDGDWIVKLPDDRFLGVPANEFATMRWASESGITVPETRLLEVSSILGLPAQMRSTREEDVFAVRRFDRPIHGKRVHIEDFAQVLDLYPHDKYRRHNYETIANIVLALAGEQDFHQLIRRYVFMVACGNGDAHHKNWSLIYPNGIEARLSPAYDLVSTIQYMQQDKLALNLAGSKQWTDVSMESFKRLARKLNYDESRLVRLVEESVEHVLSAWARGKQGFGYPVAAVERLQSHMSSVPLLARPWMISH